MARTEVKAGLWGIAGAARRVRWRSGPVERLIEEIAAVCARDTGALERSVWGRERRAEDNMEDDWQAGLGGEQTVYERRPMSRL